MSSENSGIRWTPALILLAVFLAPMLALSAYGWIAIPDDARVPTHWSLQGQADGYSSKTTALLLIPSMVLILVPLIVGLVRLDPRKAHVAQSQRFLWVVLGSMLTLMTGIHAAMILIALGAHVPMDLVVMTLVGGMFAVLGWFMRDIKSNFFMGVRTPWTLSSELSWEKTHLLTGRVFLVAGIATVLSAWILGPVVATFVLLVGTMAGSIWAIAYSYAVWKKDPARHA